MKWTTPPMEWCKVNCDVAFKKDVQRVGVRIIVRDHKGRVSAETIASYYAAQLCNQMGLQRVILEGDAKTVMVRGDHKWQKQVMEQHWASDG